MKILIVDDENISITILRYALSYFDGLDIQEAYNGEEAVSMCIEECFDIVFIDVGLPVMDGKKATKKIKALEKQTFIIAISADQSPATIHKMLKAGANDFIYKPFITHLLRNRINNYIKIIENRKYSAASTKQINALEVVCHPYFAMFKIATDSDLAYLWEYMMQTNVSKFSNNPHCRVNLALNAIFNVGNILLSLSKKFLIFVEQNELGYYFTLIGVKELNKRVVYEIVSKELQVFGDETRFVVSGNKLSIESHILQSLPVCAIDENIKVTQDIAHIAKEIVLQIYDFMEDDDLGELRAYLGDMESSLAPLQYSSLNENEVLYLAETITKISTILGGYSATYNLSITLRSLGFDIKDHVEIFIAKSKILSKIFIHFNSDLQDWQKALFIAGASSINFMDDSIISNAVSISNLIKPAEEIQDDNLDDVFMF
ncbi:MAG: hypothetical protein RL154_1070 [Pseudomonadota bacterium]|jgi:two-component system chemotaxis response regulator CheY